MELESTLKFMAGAAERQSSSGPTSTLFFVEETNGCSFKGKKIGVMHACGHDSHADALLLDAKILSLNKDQFQGVVKLCFQQAEKIGYGAMQFIKAGLVTGDISFGIHLATQIYLWEK